MIKTPELKNDFNLTTDSGTSQWFFVLKRIAGTCKPRNPVFTCGKMKFTPMRQLTLVLALAAVVSTAIPAYAQETKPVTATTKDKQEEKNKEQKDAEAYAEAIKNLKKFSGDFTFYQRKNEILLELPESQLGKLFCVQATVSLGVGSDGIQAGDPINQDAISVYAFERGTDDIRLTKPNLNFRWLGDDPLALASQRSFPQAILDNYKIEAKDPEHKLLLVNITELFYGDIMGVPQAISGAIGGGYTPDRANFSVNSIFSYPENSVVRYNLHYRKAGGGDDDGFAALLAALLGIGKSPLADSRSLPLTISFNMWNRRDTGYQPRYADPRIGYFTSDYFDVAKLKRTDRTVRLIQRFNLQKKDPKAEISEPVKPIVWYLDNTIPEEYKQAVRDGILFWNKAYEAIGFKNALVVKDAPQDENYDHADGRYNVIRWTMTENSPYAVAWFRPDPISGEIMNAAVTVDANYPASAFTEFQEQVMGASSRTPWLDDQGKQTILQELVDKPFAKQGFKRIGCDHAHGFADEASYAYNVMMAKGLPVDVKEYTRIMIADLIAHEVGHCLGLRHNFAASTLHTNAELADFNRVESQAVASSVMDYTPLNLNAVLAGNKGYYNPIIGAYDLWAIEYGYSQFGIKNTDEERYDLDQIAKKSGLRGHLFLTDEDADGENPLSVRWDLGSDTVGYLNVRSKTDALLRNYALTQATKDGESYARRNSLLLRSIRGKFSASIFAARMIGGFEFRRQLKGDMNEQPTLRPVSAADQRTAMKYIVNNVLSEVALDLPQDVLFGMSQDPSQGNNDYNAPFRDYLGRQQRLILASISNPTKLDAIAENAFKTKDASQRYTLEEHLGALYEAVFGDIGNGKAISPLRRDLQRYYSTVLIGQSMMNNGGVVTDAQILGTYHVKKLSAKIKAALKSIEKADMLTTLHLTEMNEEIDRFLKRQSK